MKRLFRRLGLVMEPVPDTPATDPQIAAELGQRRAARDEAIAAFDRPVSTEVVLAHYLDQVVAS